MNDTLALATNLLAVAIQQGQQQQMQQMQQQMTASVPVFHQGSMGSAGGGGQTQRQGNWRQQVMGNRRVHCYFEQILHTG